MSIVASKMTICLSMLTASLSFTVPARSTNADQLAKDLSEPFVAWADGGEVEFRFRLDKTKQAGLTLKDLEDVKYMRFWKDNWTREFGKVKVDLQTIAEIKFRPLQTPPFSGKLLDGRELLVIPKAEKIAGYFVTGEYFEKDVIRRLDNPLVEDPATLNVMSGIVVFGDLPHSTGPDKIHRSLGEPLSEFAVLKLAGKLGPQAVELARMRASYSFLREATARMRGTPCELIEKRFGPGKPNDPKAPQTTTEYAVKAGRLEIHWANDGKTVGYFYAITGKDWPTAKADQPEKLAKEALAMANANRAIALEMLSKMAATLTPQERIWVLELLDRTAKELQWTEGERRAILGGKK